MCVCNAKYCRVLNKFNICTWVLTNYFPQTEELLKTGHLIGNNIGISICMQTICVEQHFSYCYTDVNLPFYDVYHSCWVFLLNLRVVCIPASVCVCVCTVYCVLCTANCGLWSGAKGKGQTPCSKQQTPNTRHHTPYTKQLTTAINTCWASCVIVCGPESKSRSLGSNHPTINRKRERKKHALNEAHRGVQLLDALGKSKATPKLYYSIWYWFIAPFSLLTNYQSIFGLVH